MISNLTKIPLTLAYSMVPTCENSQVQPALLFSTTKYNKQGDYITCYMFPAVSSGILIVIYRLKGLKDQTPQVDGAGPLLR